MTAGKEAIYGLESLVQNEVVYDAQDSNSDYADSLTPDGGTPASATRYSDAV